MYRAARYARAAWNALNAARARHRYHRDLLGDAVDARAYARTDELLAEGLMRLAAAESLRREMSVLPAPLAGAPDAAGFARARVKLDFEGARRRFQAAVDLLSAIERRHPQQFGRPEAPTVVPAGAETVAGR